MSWSDTWQNGHDETMTGRQPEWFFKRCSRVASWIADYDTQSGWTGKFISWLWKISYKTVD